jgi:hypothetical protein
MSALYSCERQDVLPGAFYGLENCPAAESRVAGTVRDTLLIVLGWAIFIGAFIYPVAQIVGIVACGIALLVGSDRIPSRSLAEI